MAAAAATASPLTTTSPLQIGIEIEFVAPPNAPWEAAHLPGCDHWNHVSLSKDACFHRLASALDAAGLPACYQIKTTPLRCARNPLREAAPPGSLVLAAGYRVLGHPLRYRAREGRAGLFRYWLVRGEYNLTDDARYKAWVACELNTPILAEADVAAGEPPGLRAALAALHAADDGGEPPHISPRMCGLHVHLAPAVPGGSTVAYAQRVLTLALLLDRSVLRPLCDPTRRTPLRPFLCAAVLAADRRRDPGITRRRHPAPLPARALAHLPPAFATAEGSVLSPLWRARTWDDLAPLLELQQHHRGADPLTVAPVLCKHKHDVLGGAAAATTVEFRHAQASFSRAFVTHWARLVLALGRVALLPTDRYRAALEAMWEAAREGGEDGTMATLGELSRAATEAGMLGGGLDLEYWRVRWAQMRAGRNPDVDEDGRAVLDDDWAGA